MPQGSTTAIASQISHPLALRLLSDMVQEWIWNFWKKIAEIRKIKISKIPKGDLWGPLGGGGFRTSLLHLCVCVFFGGWGWGGGVGSLLKISLEHVYENKKLPFGWLYVNENERNHWNCIIQNFTQIPGAVLWGPLRKTRWPGAWSSAWQDGRQWPHQNRITQIFAM